MRSQLLDPPPYFADLPDPHRESRNNLHPLHDILMIVLCAVLSGVEDWVGMEAFAEEKEAWLRGFLDLPNGIPSHDTLSDVLGQIDPAAFRAAFTAWATPALPVQETVEKDHGRIEIRRYAVSSPIDWLEAKPDWAGLQAVGRVESTRIIGDQTSTECRYFLCSFADRERFAATVRGHWAIDIPDVPMARGFVYLCVVQQFPVFLLILIFNRFINDFAHVGKWMKSQGGWGGANFIEVTVS